MLEYLRVAVPRNIVDRSHLPADELAKFEKVTGILKTRRTVRSTTANFIKDALISCKMENTINRNAIEALIVVTQSPDRLSPNMAVEIHKFLGLPAHVPALDINHACDGFIVGLWAGQKLSNKTMVICVDRLRYNKTPMESLIFSDSVSIAVVNGNYQHHMDSYTDGSKFDKLHCGLDGDMDMNGNDVFDFVTTEVPKLLRPVSDKYDFLAPHQANESMNRILEIRSGFKGRTLYSIREYGNQSMNSVPTNLAHNESAILGKSVLMCGFGAGYTAATMSINWPHERIAKIVEVN